MDAWRQEVLRSSLPDTAPAPANAAAAAGDEPGSPGSDVAKKEGLVLSPEAPAPVSARTVLSAADATAAAPPRGGGLAKQRSSLRDFADAVVGCFHWRMTRQQVGGRQAFWVPARADVGASYTEAQQRRWRRA